HKDLRGLVASGHFREDLYYRINVIELRVPPLRERGEDIALLTRHILARLAAGMGMAVPTLTPEARARLQGYAFPVLERAVALAGEVITADDIQVHQRVAPGSGPAAVPGTPVAGAGPATGPLAAPGPSGGAAPPAGAPREERLDSVERETILEALKAHRYNRTATARTLGLTLRALRYRMQKLGID
ncbi:MAG: sigma-54-dependent Fis family transcriptional regulator, partial [Gammaproteobacteria bacterium]|nr:sigma-54-dependent Fis family transcriptional regulator [Gammaproteobacteria bacterium]